MKISELIDQLERTREREGDIEVTCTGSTLPDDSRPTGLSDVFETTVETIVILDGGAMRFKRARLYL